nr:brachyurin-like isoform X2 [Onthophagus taurus]
MFTLIFLGAIFTLAQANYHHVEDLQPKVFPPKSLHRLILSKSPIDNKIINGNEVDKHSIPYQAGIFFDLPNGKQGFCGGSLISNRYILTAAHCTNGSLSAEVILGAHHIWEDEPTQIRIKSSELRTHELYGTNGNLYDIGLIQLPNPVKLNKHINTVSLPSRKHESHSFVDEDARVSGWGITSDDATGISDVLKSAESFIMENWLCSLFFFGAVRDSHICSEGHTSQVSACRGDSGGPIVVDNVQVGLVSFGSGFGCESMWPTVYTRITSYLDWIEKHTDVKIKE